MWINTSTLTDWARRKAQPRQRWTQPRRTNPTSRIRRWRSA